MVDLVLSWLLTYWLHSTVLLLSAWALSAVLAGRNAALEERIWRLALVGALLTTSLQLGLAGVGDWRPFGGTVPIVLNSAAETGPVAGGAIATPGPAARTAASAAALPAGTLPEEALAVAGPSGSVDGGTLRRLARGAAGSLAAGASSVLAATRARPAAVAVGAWLAIAMLLLMRLGTAYGMLCQRLLGRQPLDRGPVPSLLNRLRQGAGIRRHVALSVCRWLWTPLARGIRRWEVCLPSRAADELDEAEQEIVLAHELAHLVRRDTAWQLGLRVVCQLLFFQPLNFVAAARLRHLAELQCDDWAVEQTGRPITLAKCLTRVAGWRQADATVFQASTMASSSTSQFGARVRRLLDRNYPLPRAEVPRWLQVAVLPVLLLTVAAVPSVVSAGRLVEEPAPTPPAQVEAREAAPRVRAVAVLAPSTRPDDRAWTVRGLPSPPVAPQVAESPCEEVDEVRGGAPEPVSWTASVVRPLASLAPPAPPAPAAAPDPVLSAPAAAVVPVVRWLVEEFEPAPAPVVAALAPFVADADGSDSSREDWVWEDEAADERGDEREDTEGWQFLQDDLVDAWVAAASAAEEALSAVELDFEALQEGELALLAADTAEALETAVEALATDLEASGERAEQRRRAREIADRERERELARIEREMRTFKDRYGRELERLHTTFERQTRQLFDGRRQRELERTLLAHERELERRLEAASRELEAMARRVESAEDPEERRHLRLEIRRKTAELRPSPETLAELRAEADRLRAEMESRRGEFQKLRRELEVQQEAVRERLTEAMERLRQDLQDVFDER